MDLAAFFTSAWLPTSLVALIVASLLYPPLTAYLEKQEWWRSLSSSMGQEPVVEDYRPGSRVSYNAQFRFPGVISNVRVQTHFRMRRSM